MSLQLGPHTIDALEAGTFALDGGAMFGVVPKPLWERKIPADDRNRIPLALRCLLVRTAGRVVLVDAGIGTDWSDKERAIYSIESTQKNIDGELARLGLSRTDVTDVVLTHLHFDHVGGALVRGADGAMTLAFPRATHHVQRRNWAWAHHPSERDKGSHRPQTFEALADSGRLHLVEGETELLPGVFLLVSEGHTVGMQLVRVTDGEQSLTFCADLIPTSAHLKPAWTMAYDLHPLTAIEEKKMLVAEALEDGGILVFEHDPFLAACRVREEAGDIVVGERIDL